LRAANPRLVYCAISGYGQSGPNIGLPASDSVMQAYGGFMSIIGEEGSSPLRVANIVSDMLSGTNAFASVLLALVRRAETGAGGEVSTCLLDSIIGFQAAIFSEYLVTGELPRRRGNRHPLIAASGVFKASDGYVAFTVLDHYWRTFCDTMGLGHLLADPRFATSETRQQHRTDVADAFQQAVAQRTVQEVLDLLGEQGVLCAPVQDYAALTRDPQVLHNQLLSRLQLPNGHTVPMVRPPMTVDGPARVWTAPPSLGQHSVQILRDDLGLAPAQIDALLTRKAVVAVAA
ncbi:MAG: CoA transferase, partial [Haliea sp.]